jgi:hypothetical protein
LRLNSRLTVDADRPKWRAINRSERRMLIRPLNEALHPSPPQIARESYRANHIKRSVFTSIASFRRGVDHFRSSPISRRFLIPSACLKGART